ncbi:hypothetical protein BELL_0391g00010 [Botrytis elliptica]|uniref:Uncharacterized protein n=1 Tax=Botrytis elliptica TaxID=278938 RepID=A0A4Z1JHR8_9HELO|nr:hypothetical protein BELL_0391g00010 [Botrytis elliptica]
MHPSFRGSEDINFFPCPQLGLKTAISVGRNYLHKGSQRQNGPFIIPQLSSGVMQQMFVHRKQNIAKQDKV